MKVFRVKFEHDGRLEDVFPGLTGDYDWALKVSGETWGRNGQIITPQMMRIYEAEEVDE